MLLGIDPKVDYAFKRPFGREQNVALLMSRPPPPEPDATMTATASLASIADVPRHAVTIFQACAHHGVKSIPGGVSHETMKQSIRT
jgi:hypothetical protein